MVSEAATAWHGMFVSQQAAEGKVLVKSESQRTAELKQQRNPLSFLHLQLEGQQGTCAPLFLETLSTTKLEVSSDSPFWSSSRSDLCPDVCAQLSNALTLARRCCAENLAMRDKSVRTFCAECACATPLLPLTLHLLGSSCSRQA